ncbi:MAG: vitamin K epoxide reductase, partial [Candidatus Saccharimonadales bacterium]
TTILVWFAITRYNLREDNLYLSKSLSKKVHSWLDNDYDKFVMATLILVIVGGIILKYGNGLFS